MGPHKTTVSNLWQDRVNSEEVEVEITQDHELEGALIQIGEGILITSEELVELSALVEHLVNS